MQKIFAFVLLRVWETGDLYFLGKSVQSVAETLWPQKLGHGVGFVWVLSLALQLAQSQDSADCFARSF